MKRIVLLLAFFAPWLADANRADYTMLAEYSEDSSWVDMDVRVKYTNDSGVPLDSIVFYCEPVAYSSRETRWSRDRATDVDRGAYFASREERGEFNVVGAWAGDARLAWRKSADGTIASVPLKRALAPGDSAEVRIIARLRLPAMIDGWGRKGRGIRLERWYPRVAVFDEGGWHARAVPGRGEVYAEEGDYDVAVLLPDDLTAAASGVLDSTWTTDGGRMWRFTARGASHFALVAEDELVSFVDAARSDLTAFAKNAGRAERLFDAAASAVDSFTAWFGPPPFDALSVAADVPGESGSRDGLVIVDEVPVGRFMEFGLAEQTARGWFAPAASNAEGVFLDRAMARYAAIRWIECTWGERGNLMELPRPFSAFGSLDARSLARLDFASQCSAPLQGAPGDSTSPTDRSLEAQVVRGALVLSAVESTTGRDRFDAAVRRYLSSCDGESGSIDLLARSFADGSDTGASALIRYLAGTPAPLDVSVAGCDDGPDTTLVLGSSERRAFRVSNGTPIGLRLPVGVRDESGRTAEARVYVSPGGRVIGVACDHDVAFTFDPHGFWPDADPRNNRSPRSFSIEAIVPRMPRPDADQLAIIPYAWHSPGANEFLFGGYILGHRMFGASALGGGHMFVGAIKYSTGWRKFGGSASYSAPVSGPDPQVSVGAGLRVDWEVRGVSLSTSYLEPPILPTDQWAELSVAVAVEDLFKLDNYDTLAYERARVGVFSLAHYVGQRSARVEDREGWTLKLIADLERDEQGARLDWTHEHVVFFTPSAYLGLRAFVGFSAGTIPAQEQFQAFGSLEPRGVPVAGRGMGMFGTTRHMSMFGEAYLRGYGGRGLRGRQCHALNAVIRPSSLPLFAFFDVGSVYDEPFETSVHDLLADAGLGLRFGPLTVQFPVWASEPEGGESEWAFRWLMGVDERF